MKPGAVSKKTIQSNCHRVPILWCHPEKHCCVE